MLIDEKDVSSFVSADRNRLAVLRGEREQLAKTNRPVCCVYYLQATDRVNVVLNRVRNQLLAYMLVSKL